MDRGLTLVAIAALTLAVSLVFRALSHRRHAIRSIDPAHLADARGPLAAVVFTSPFCHGCREWIDALTAHGLAPLALDVVARPELAARYRINATPRIAVVRTADGEVLGEWDHYSPRAHDVDRVVSLLDDR